MPGIHDWNNILSQLDMLQSAHSIATVVSWFATILMLMSFIWGAVVLKIMSKQTQLS